MQAGKVPGEATAHDADQLRLWHWPGKQIALPDMTADGLQLMALVGCLDALGNRAKTEALGKLHNGLAQTRIDAIEVAVGDTASIESR
jgi:hypothetical protein